MADAFQMDHARVNLSVDAIRDWLRAKCAEALGVTADAIDPHAAFESYGLSSVQAVSLVGDLEEWIGWQLPATLLWDIPTLDAVARELSAASEQKR